MLKVEVFGQNLQNIVEIFFHIVMFFSVGSVLLMYRIEKLYIFFGRFRNNVHQYFNILIEWLIP